MQGYVSKMKNNLVKLQGLISKLTDDWSYGHVEKFDLVSYIEEYSSGKINENYSLSIINNTDVNAFQKGVFLRMNKSNLTTVLDNIIANAVNHGFTNPNRNDYAIKIEYGDVSFEKKTAIGLSIRNNGERLPVGMTSDKVFAWGVGIGTGLGSWQSKSIVEHFGGTIEFIQHEDRQDGFNIEYKIVLPIEEEL